MTCKPNQVEMFSVQFRESAKYGDLEQVKYFIEEKKVDLSFGDNRWAIVYASRNGHLEVVQFLASQFFTSTGLSCLLPTVDPGMFKNKAIQEASQNGHLEVVRFLASLSICVPITTPRLASIAVVSPNMQLTESSVSFWSLPIVNPSSGDNYAFRLASHNGHLEVMKFLASLPGVDPSADNNDAILRASQDGYLEIVQFLASFPCVDPSADNNRAIQWASQEGHLEIVKFLASLSTVSGRGACVDPSARGDYAIRWASRNGHLEIVQFLASLSRVNPYARGDYAIRWACNNGHYDVSEFLEKKREFAMNRS